MAGWLKCWMAALKQASSHASCAITFTFGLMPLGKGMNPFMPLSYGLNHTTTDLL